MSLYDRLAPPEPEFSDEEWDRAEQALIEERLEMGWSEQESRVAVDDYLIAEKCERMREDDERDPDQERDAAWDRAADEAYDRWVETHTWVGRDD